MKPRSVLILLLALCISIGMLVQCLQDRSSDDEVGHEVVDQQKWNIQDISKQERQQQLYQFVVHKLMGDEGVFTNYMDTDQVDSLATGHEVLSESSGLLLRYYARTGQKQKFDQAWTQTKQTFDRESGFSYRYSPKQNKHYPLNAAVDDLRIIRALYEASEQFDDVSYKQELHNYGQRLFAHNVKESYLYDFYDEEYKLTNNFITLCYIDLLTIQLIIEETEMDDQLLSNMKSIIQEGYLTDQFPFYETRFSYDSNSYQSERINTVESLLTILALSEIKQQQAASISYIREHVKQGTLYGQYTLDGKPANDVQSTAIYAITAMIGAELGDEELYEDSVARMSQFQIQDAASPLFGGFGDLKTEVAYSFDNLMALMAYAYVQK